MLKRFIKILVAKFTIKLLNSVDLYKTIHGVRENMDQKIHSIQENMDQKIRKIHRIQENMDQKIHNIQLRLSLFPQDILKIFFNELSFNPSAMRFSEKLRSILTLYRPLDKKFIRKGNYKDGGYVIVDDLKINDTLFSIGVGDNITFDIDCENQVSGIVLVDDSVPDFCIPHGNYSLSTKKLGIFDSESSITLGKLLNTFPSDDYILKMDIEGDEWKILSSLPSTIISKFRQIIIEFHSIFDSIELDEKLNILTNLLETHALVVVHPNNIGGYQVIGNQLFPNELETTWLRRDSYNLIKGIDSEVLRLLVANDPEKSDIWISWANQ